MPIDNAFATHPGRAAEAAEKKNEDFAHAWIKDKVSFQITADGNGSSEYLNPASFVVNEIQRFIDTYSEPGMSVAEIKRMISGAFHCANRVLLAFKKANGELYTNNVFATVDLTAITEKNELIMAHVGDGRIYLVRNQKLQQVSKDHTEAQRLCDLGKITREQIYQHPDRDLLTAALGFENPHIDLRTGKVQSEDILILLTDGAHKVLNNAQIHEIIYQAGNCFETCNGIIKVANTLGGPDNISVCVSYIASAK